MKQEACAQVFLIITLHTAVTCDSYIISKVFANGFVYIAFLKIFLKNVEVLNNLFKQCLSARMKHFHACISITFDTIYMKN